MGTPLKDETGNRYGMLTVLRRYDTSDPSSVGAYWLCRCDCGKEVAVQGTKLRNGNTRSCGCLAQMSKAERERLGFKTVGEIMRERRKERRERTEIMKKEMDPAIKILYLQLDAMTGLRRALQEQVDKADARIKETQDAIRKVEAKPHV